MSALPSRDESPRHSKVVQRLFERPSSAMEPAHDRPYRYVHDVGDLFVGETLDIGKEHRHPERLRKRLQSCLDLVICDPGEGLVLGAAADSLVRAPEAPEEVELLDVVELGLLRAAGAGAVGVDEGVR